MNNPTDEPLGLSPNRSLESDQTAPPTEDLDSPLEKAFRFARLLLRENVMTTYELQDMFIKIYQEQAATTGPFEAMDSGNQRSPPNSNSEVQQRKLVPISGRPLPAFLQKIDPSVTLLGELKKLMGYQGPTEVPTEAPKIQDVTMGDQSSVPDLDDAGAPAEVPQPQNVAKGDQPSVPDLDKAGVPVEPPQSEDVAMDDQLSVPDLDVTQDFIPEEVQLWLANDSLPDLGEEEVVIRARDATEDDTIPVSAFPAHQSDTATHQPDTHQGIDREQLGVPLLDHESLVNMGELANVANHSDATNASLEQLQRIATKSTLRDESITPADHNITADDSVAIPAELKEQIQHVVLAPLGAQGISPMTEFPAEQAACAPGNAPLGAKIPTTEPSEGGSAGSSSRASTRNSSSQVPNKAHARSSSTATLLASGRPAKRARLTNWRGIRGNSAPPSMETRAQELDETLPLFAALPADEAIPGYSTTPGQVGLSARYSLRPEMSVYDVFVAMRAENDRNRATSVRNANGDLTFTWDESDIRFLDSLYRSSRL